MNVSARLNADSEEETEERWDPTTVVRSKQTATDTGATLMAGGIAGARANAPRQHVDGGDADPRAARPRRQGASHMSETTNYEVSKVTRHKIVPRGQLARLSVAVILDDDHVTTKGPKGEIQVADKPRSPQDLQRIQHLVAASVGVDPDRGDEADRGEHRVRRRAGRGRGARRQLVAAHVAAADEGRDGRRGRARAAAGHPARRPLGFTMILRPMMRRALNLPPAVELAPGQLPTHPPSR